MPVPEPALIVEHSRIAPREAGVVSTRGASRPSWGPRPGAHGRTGRAGGGGALNGLRSSAPALPQHAGAWLPSLDDVDQLLNRRRRPGDDEAVGGVIGDDPNPGRGDPGEGVRQLSRPSIGERDHLDGHGPVGDPYGRDDPHTCGPAEEAIAVQGESRLQELERLRRRNALRREQRDLPLYLLGVEEKRDPREPANVLDDGLDVCVLETQGLRGGGPSWERRAHEEKAEKFFFQ